MNISQRWWLLLLVSLVLPISALYVGAADLSFVEVTACLTGDCASPTQQLIFTQIRVPRVMIGFLVGAGLAVAGATLQNITRNSLADPYLFGVAAGAGLGASVASLVLQLDHINALGLSFSLLLPVCAFLGAMAAVFVAQLIAMSAIGSRTERLILAGVAVSFLFSALTQLLIYLAEPYAANKVIFWLMGSLARAESGYIWVILPVLVACLILLLLYANRIDALLLGDEQAQSLGVNVVRLRILLLFICAALTACIVAYCGGIGFVGLMIPHIIRQWLGATSRILILGCVLLGGSFLVTLDMFARSILSGQEIPIGVITSAVGGVFFLFALRDRR